MINSTIIPPNKSRQFYYKMNKWMYALGAPNYWYEDFSIPEYVKTIHDIMAKVCDIMLYLFFISMWGSFYTQHNLSEKQKTDALIFSLCNPIMYMFVPILSRKAENVRKVTFNLMIKMKETYNDTEVEEQMIQRVKVYCVMFSGIVTSAIILYGVNGAVMVYFNDGTFVTLVTAWPEVNDRSYVAGVIRILAYLMWWILAIRTLSVMYVAVILMTIGLSHEYKNLCSYFYGLNDIFEEKFLCYEEKEMKYEAAFKIGIEMHSNILRCTKIIQETYSLFFSFQIFMNISTLIVSMFQMMNAERTPTSVLATVGSITAILLSTGCLWWNAGDVTVEATKLPTAMFSSGWQHCRRETARRVRPIVTIAMWQSQVQVELRCLGVMPLSYSTYLLIVRTAYSVFSVLY